MTLQFCNKGREFFIGLSLFVLSRLQLDKNIVNYTVISRCLIL